MEMTEHERPCLTLSRPNTQRRDRGAIAVPEMRHLPNDLLRGAEDLT